MSGDLIERMAKAMAAKCRRDHDWPFWIEEARAALGAILAAGLVVVPHEISNEACDKALGATKNWQDIDGDRKFVNREKMRRRWRQALIIYKHEMRAMIADSITEILPEGQKSL